MVLIDAGLGSEKRYADDDQQQLQIPDHALGERAPHIMNCVTEWC
jgi:hypothetical protein